MLGVEDTRKRGEALELDMADRKEESFYPRWSDGYEGIAAHSSISILRLHDSAIVL